MLLMLQKREKGIFVKYKNKNYMCLRYTTWSDIHIHSEIITMAKLIIKYNYYFCVQEEHPDMYSLSRFPVFSISLLVKFIFCCIFNYNI